jgi:hypothetical protein
LIVTRLAGLQLTLISLQASPMARRVRVQVTSEAAAADIMLAGNPWPTSCRPVSEVEMPTTPVMSAKMTKNPVARLPIGK